MTSRISELVLSWCALIINSSETVTALFINGVSPQLVCLLFLSSNLLSFYLSRFYRIFLEYYPITSFYLLYPIKRASHISFTMRYFRSIPLVLLSPPFFFNITFLYLMVNPTFYGTFVGGGLVHSASL